MIISLRGTNGSGKSTIVRNIMKLYPHETKIEYPGRRKPIGYVLRLKNRTLFVPGHYEILNGGIDTIDSLATAYNLIAVHAVELGCDVLYEGKNLSDGPKRLLELQAAGHDVAVAHINLPVEDCISAVRLRGHTIKVETIEKLHIKSQHDLVKFGLAGVPVFSGNREDTLMQVKSWLKI